MANHDAASALHRLRGLAANAKPILFAVTADDIAALREEGYSDAAIEQAVTMLAPHLERAALLLPGALLRRADEVEGAR